MHIRACQIYHAKLKKNTYWNQHNIPHYMFHSLSWFFQEMVVAQRKAKAEVMRTFVEEFLSKAYYNQFHMFDP